MKRKLINMVRDMNIHRLRIAYDVGTPKQIQDVYERNRRELAEAEARDYREIRK